MSEAAVVHTVKEAYKTVEYCRSCGSDRLEMFFDCGNLHIVEFPLLGQPPIKPKVPLRLLVCKNCWLVQLRHTANPAHLFSEFWYRSGTNEMMQAELRSIAQSTIIEADLISGEFVLDIGCNDGTMLGYYPGRLHRVGFDPAKNIKRDELATKGCTFVETYFSADAALDASAGVKYKAVTAIAMFYDLDDPVHFCKEVKRVLDYDGVFVVQMNYLPEMLRVGGVDNICHEHLTYYSLSSLQKTMEAAGLVIYKVILNEVNGGSIRVYATHSGQHILPDISVKQLLAIEELNGLRNLKTYHNFQANFSTIAASITGRLEGLSSQKKRIWAYGASTRGATLLQLLPELRCLVAVAERDPAKFGRYMAVGAELPIKSEEEFRKEADIALVLPWHFREAILKREKEWMYKGGRMLFPLPIPMLYPVPGPPAPPKVYPRQVA